MKFLILLTIFSTMNISASLYSQETRLSLSIEGKTLKEAFKMIEGESAFRFFYSDNFNDLNKVVNYSARSKKIDEIMSTLLNQSTITYKVLDNNVIVIIPLSNPLPQPRTVEGRITDNNDQPLVGVTVIIKGTTQGTITDVNGNFQLSNVPEGATLQFSFVGMKTVEMPLGEQLVFNIKMEEEMLGLEEVVVIGFGTQKKVNLTGSVASVQVDEKITSRSITSVSSALSGLIPGLSVQQQSGFAGNDDAVLRIRGIGTPNNSSPLIVVDGMPDVDINRLNINDIESVSVLKDAASAAIYGSRAANGVILITTRRGQADKTTFNYTGLSTWSDIVNYYDYVPDHVAYMNFYNDSYNAGGKVQKYLTGTVDQWMAMGQIDPIRFPNTDWWDLYFKTGNIQNHNLSASGGTDRMNFFLSGGFLTDNGMSVNNSFKRINLRLNLDYNILDKVKVGTTIGTNWSKHTYPYSEGFHDGTSTGNYYRLVPGITPYDEQGRAGGMMAYREETIAMNLIAHNEQRKNDLTQQQAVINLYGQWEPLNGLSLRVDYGLDFFNGFRKNWTDPLIQWNFQTEEALNVITNFGGISNRFDNRYKTLMQGRAVYTTDLFNGHTFTAMAVYTEEYWFSRWLTGGRSYRLNPSLSELAGATPEIVSANGNSASEGLRSGIGRLNYSIKDKYLFETNLRADASSKFTKGNRLGIFPSFSAGWRFSQEGFFDPLLNIVNNAKIRASYGELGNNSGVGRYEQREVFLLTNYMYGDNLSTGVAVNQLLNPFLSWEKTRVINLGLDLVLLNKIYAELDVYERLTSDIIRPSELPQILNQTFLAPRMNIGELQNRGFEANLEWRDNIGDFSYNVQFNYSFNKNKVLSWNERLGYGDTFLGFPLSYVRGYIASGIAQSWEDVLNAPYQGKPLIGPGDVLLEDVNGDGQITAEDQVPYRNSPRNYFNSHYGLGFNTRWKNFDLNLLFQASTGSKDYWSDIFNKTQVPNTTSHFFDFHSDAWNYDNPGGEIPRLTNQDQSTNNDVLSTFWLYDRDYIRLKNVQFGYSLPKSLLRKANISNLRIYASGENLFTLTNWPGIDPEKSKFDPGKNSMDSNTEWDAYPLRKSVSIGINLDF